MAVAYRYGEIKDRDNHAIIDCPICNGKGCKATYKSVSLSLAAAKMYELAELLKPISKPVDEPEGFHCNDGIMRFNQSCLPFIGEDVWQFIQICQLADIGHLPEDGGIMNQSNTFKAAYLYYRNDERLMKSTIENRYGNR